MWGSFCIFLCLWAFGNVTGRTSYYISETGDDHAAGTSPASAWATTAPLTKATLHSGDTIAFNGTIPNPIGFGISVSGITLQPFGTAPPVIVTSNDQSNGVWVHASDVVIKGLTLVGPAAAEFRGRFPTVKRARPDVDSTRYGWEELPKTRALTAFQMTSSITGSGVLAWTDKGRHNGPTVVNVEVYGWKVGVTIGGWNTVQQKTGTPGFDNPVLSHIKAHHNIYQGITTYGKEYTTLTNVTIQYCTCWNNRGDPTYHENHSGSGIIVSGATGGVVHGCVAYDNGDLNASNGGGPVGIWMYHAENIIIQHCVAYNNSEGTGSFDGGGFDIDGGSRNGTIQYVLSFNNAGPGALVCMYSGGQPTSGATVQYSVSYNDGRRSQNAASVDLYTPSSLTDTLLKGNTWFMSQSPPSPAVINVQSGKYQHTQVHQNAFIVMDKTAQGSSLIPNEPPLVRVSGGSSWSYFNITQNEYWVTNGGKFFFQDGTTVYSNYNSWRKATGEETKDGKNTGLTQNPQLKTQNPPFFSSCVPKWDAGVYPDIPNSPLLDALRGFSGDCRSMV